jgi:hypothetical protein
VPPSQSKTGTHRLLTVLRRRQDALEQQGRRRADRGELGLEVFRGVAGHRAMGCRLVGLQRRPTAGRAAGMTGDAPSMQEDADQGGGRVDIDRFADRGVGNRVGGAVDHDMVIRRQLVAAPGTRDEAVRRQRPQMGTLLFGQDPGPAGGPVATQRCGVQRGQALPDRSIGGVETDEDGVANRRQYAPLDLQNRILDRRLVSRLTHPRRNDGDPVVLGEVVVAGIDGGIVEGGVTDADLEIVGDQAGRNAAYMLQQPDMGGQPILRPLGPGRFGIDVAGIRQAGDEDLRRTRLGADPDHQGHAGVIDFQRVAGQMVAPQPGNRPGGLPVPEALDELGVAVAVGLANQILLPEQVERHAPSAQFAFDRRPIRQRP